MKYQLHERQQHAKQGKGGFNGPDAYIAVTIAPDDAVVPAYLNRTVLEKRGIEIKYLGDGYAKYRGPKSQLGQAIKKAKEWIANQSAEITDQQCGRCENRAEVLILTRFGTERVCKACADVLVRDGLAEVAR